MMTVAHNALHGLGLHVAPNHEIRAFSYLNKIPVTPKDKKLIKTISPNATKKMTL
jgi:hypothetical protein